MFWFINYLIKLLFHKFNHIQKISGIPKESYPWACCVSCNVYLNGDILRYDDVSFCKICYDDIDSD